MPDTRATAAVRQLAVRKTTKLLTSLALRPFALGRAHDYPVRLSGGSWMADATWRDRVEISPTEDEIKDWCGKPDVRLGIALGIDRGDGTLLVSFNLARLTHTQQAAALAALDGRAMVVGGEGHLSAICRIDAPSEERMHIQTDARLSCLVSPRRPHVLAVPLIGLPPVANLANTHKQSGLAGPYRWLIGPFTDTSLPLLPSGNIVRLVRAMLEEKIAANDATGAVHPARTPLMKLVPTAWEMPDPSKLPKRGWLYSNLFGRGMVSVTVSPGGVGKSTLAIAECIAIASGVPILGEAVHGGPHRVWYVNLEDPENPSQPELSRRASAIAMHYGITNEQLGGRLFLNSGLATPLKVGGPTQGKGWAIDGKEVERLKSEVRRNKIDVVIIDPFVASHDLDENNNIMIDRVVKALVTIAMDCDCAVGLVHHTRKNGQAEHDAESARGAGSLIAGARVARVLNPMTISQADEYQIPPGKHRSFFRASIDKQNMSVGGGRRWLQLVSVELGNGETCGVPEFWRPPDTASSISDEDVQRVQAAVAAGNFGENQQAADWGGYVIGPLVGIDPHDPRGKRRVARLIARLVAANFLTIDRVPSKSSKKKERPMLRVGRPTSASDRDSDEQDV